MSRRAPLRTLFDDDRDPVAACLIILERGMRRLGINPAEKMTRMAARTAGIGAGPEQVEDPEPAERAKRVEGQAKRLARPAQLVPAPAKPRRPYAPHFTPAQLAKIESLHRAGHTQSQIARTLRCTQSAIAKRLARSAGIAAGPGQA